MKVFGFLHLCLLRSKEFLFCVIKHKLGNTLKFSVNGFKYHESTELLLRLTENTTSEEHNPLRLKQQTEDIQRVRNDYKASHLVQRPNRKMGSITIAVMSVSLLVSSLKHADESETSSVKTWLQ